MMNGMMSELGVYLDAAEEIPASSTSYRPESCTDYEAGVRFGINAAGHFPDRIRDSDTISAAGISRLPCFRMGRGPDA